MMLTSHQLTPRLPKEAKKHRPSKPTTPKRKLQESPNNPQSYAVKYFGSREDGKLGVTTEHLQLTTLTNHCTSRHPRAVSTEKGRIEHLPSNMLSGKQLISYTRRPYQWRPIGLDITELRPAAECTRRVLPHSNVNVIPNRTACPVDEIQRKRIQLRSQVAQKVARFRQKFRKEWYPGKEQEVSSQMRNIEAGFMQLSMFNKKWNQSVVQFHKD